MAGLIYKSAEDSFILHVHGEEIYLDYSEVERAYLAAKKRRADEEKKFEEQCKQKGDPSCEQCHGKGCAQCDDTLYYEEQDAAERFRRDRRTNFVRQAFDVEF